jgi:mono/diheme cytochrome c family protein
MKYLFTFCSLLTLLAFAGRPDRLPVVEDDTPLYDVYRSLGAPERSDVKVRPVEGASVKLGRELVINGLSAGGGQQSAHFKCTSCHNLEREDPILTEMDPAARLAYAEEHDLPFLPGTTFWGVVTRESYYNGDYEKKYGDLVKSARRDLREAIQLCATECAQGKALNEVEMESVVAYFHTLGLRLNDLPEGAPDAERVNRVLRQGGDNKRSMINTLKTYYALASPATFVLPPENRQAGYPTEAGRPEVGQIIYRRACLHCHENQRYSFFEMGETQYDYNFMTKHFPRYTRYSIYQVSRYGTSPIPGKRAYMPHYTKERMSNQQIEDLRTYLASKAKL